MIETLYTKKEIYDFLKKGAILGDLLDMSDGQECTVFKSDYFPEDEEDYNVVIYIPDLDQNEIVYDRRMTTEEIAEAYTNLYTAQDFIDICGGDKDKAETVFYNCDWQHPSSEFDEMEMIGWTDEAEEQPWHAITRWCADDVIEAAKENGIKMTVAQAEHWWKENENGFHEALAQAGNELLADMDFGEV